MFRFFSSSKEKSAREKYHEALNEQSSARTLPQSPIVNIHLPPTTLASLFRQYPMRFSATQGALAGMVAGAIAFWDITPFWLLYCGILGCSIVGACIYMAITLLAITISSGLYDVDEFDMEESPSITL